MRKTGAKMMMDGCTTKDRVDDVRVGHVQQVGHGVWQCGVRSETELVGLGKKLSEREFFL